MAPYIPVPRVKNCLNTQVEIGYCTYSPITQSLEALPASQTRQLCWSRLLVQITSFNLASYSLYELDMSSVTWKGSFHTRRRTPRVKGNTNSKTQWWTRLFTQLASNIKECVQICECVLCEWGRWFVLTICRHCSSSDWWPQVHLWQVTILHRKCHRKTDRGMKSLRGILCVHTEKENLFLFGTNYQTRVREKKLEARLAFSVFHKKKEKKIK